MQQALRIGGGLWLLVCLLGLARAQVVSAPQLYQQAKALEKQKQYAEAAKKMRAAVKLEPKNDAFLAYTAKVEYLAEEYSAATDHAIAAAKLKPNTPIYHVLAMKSAHKANDLNTARKFAGNVIKLKRVLAPEYVAEAEELVALPEGKAGAPLYQQAMNFHRQGDIQQAIAVMKKAKAASPGEKDYADYLILLERRAHTHDLDTYARKADLNDEQSLETLAKYLLKPAKTERDKARLIFAWIADRVAHDIEARRKGKADDETASGVFLGRKGTPLGYANLFAALGKLAGLEVEIVKGHAKGPGYQPDQDLRFWQHHWNAVKIDDKWLLIDCQRGAGTSFTKFEKKFTPFFFCPAPETLLFSHRPEEEKWQLVEKAADVKEWQQWPLIEPTVFDFGILPSKIRARLGQNGFKGFVRAVNTPGPQIFLHDAPIDAHLQAGTTYTFRIEAIGFDAIAVFSGDQSERLKKNGKVFEGTFTPKQAGALNVSGQVKARDDLFRSILVYEVD